MTKHFLCAIGVILMVLSLQGNPLALTYEGLPLEEALVTADAIIVGTVAGVESRWEDGPGNRAWIYVTVVVEEVIKGRNIGGTVQVKTFLPFRPEDPDYGLPRFSMDEKVLLLLSKHENTPGLFWMRDCYESKFTYIDGRIAGSSTTLQDFKQQIRELLAGSRASIALNSAAAKVAHAGYHLNGQFRTFNPFRLPKTTPLTFKINPADATDPDGNPLSFESIKTALQTAISNSWNGVSASSARFQIDPDSTTLGPGTDDHSVICWTDLGPPDVVGARNWYYKIDSSTSEIISVDIEFNSQLNWSVSDTYPSPCDPDNGPKDFQNVAAHELGHSLGLAHCSDTYTQYTMYRLSGRCETGQRSLESGDKAGSVYLGANGTGGGIQFDMVWLARTSLTLTGNVTVPTGRTLEIEAGKTINLNNYYIKSTGGTITDQGATWNPDIAVKQGSTLKGHYSTIQSAINAASSGQTVYVAPGTYNEQLSMKSGVDLKKNGSGTVKIWGSGPTGEEPVAYFYGDSDILVEGIHFDGYGWDAVEVINSGSGITFRNCEFTVAAGGQGDAGLYVSGGTSAPRVETSKFHGIYYGMQVNNAYVNFYSQNKVYNNTYGVYCSNNGLPDLDPDNNFSYPSPHNSSYDIYAASNVYGNIYARNNFWGYVDGELRDPDVYHANPSYSIDTSNPRSTPAKIVGGRSLVASAQEKLRLGEYSGALADFKRVIEAPRSQEEVLAAVHGVMFASRTPQEVEKAISYLEGIAQARAGSEVGAAALYVTLSGLVLRRDYEKALSRIDHLLDASPQSAYAPYALLEKAFLFRYGYGDREVASRLFAEIVERYPDWEELPMVLAKLGGRERMREGASEEEPIVSLSSYPNPANPTATLRFALPQTAPVSLVIYNLLGQSVRTLLEDAMLGPGAHAIRWDGKDGVGQDLASGLYLCRLEAGGRMKAKKLLLLR